MRVYTILLVCVLSGLPVLLAGCSESESAYAEKKKAMKTQWDKSTADAKIPVIEDMLERGEIEQAKKELQKCIQANPDNPKIYALIGRIHYAEGRNDQARAAFEQAVERDPETDRAWYWLGSLAVQDKDYEKALRCYQQALTLKPVETDYVLGASDILVEMGQYEQARGMLETALAHDSHLVQLHIALARLTQRQGNTKEAIAIYENAEFMNGPLPEILEPAAYACMADHQWAKAAQKFKQLLETLKDDTEREHVAMRSLAMCLFNAGQYESALGYYDKLSVVYRDDVDLWLSMGQAALGSSDAKRAAYSASNALKYDPSNAQARAVLGSAEYMQGRYERSLETFYKIVDDDELGAFAWFMSARCYQQLGQHIQANTAYDRARALDPNSELITAFIHPEAIQ